MKVLLSILKKILAVVTVLAIVCGVIVGYNVTWLNKTFITTFYSVETDKDISDLRIVELSDLHLHEYGTKNAELVERIRNLNPNIIAIAGDMRRATMNGHQPIPTIIVSCLPILRRRARITWFTTMNTLR